ncbi:hypothetical protein JZ751_000782 [Albula glossodonta]|uniref:Uncharacterized protein n=1 Tax=Albula glossodonta TaxID=121402 RepID=A0A8T2PXD9_9TELE|nr:hypothetical protein JZ751_000782 [Albula glossodonta]
MSTQGAPVDRGVRTLAALERLFTFRKEGGTHRCDHLDRRLRYTGGLRLGSHGVLPLTLMGKRHCKTVLLTWSS